MRLGRRARRWQQRRPELAPQATTPVRPLQSVVGAARIASDRDDNGRTARCTGKSGRDGESDVFGAGEVLPGPTGSDGAVFEDAGARAAGTFGDGGAAGTGAAAGAACTGAAPVPAGTTAAGGGVAMRCGLYRSSRSRLASVQWLTLVKP